MQQEAKTTIQQQVPFPVMFARVLQSSRQKQLKLTEEETITCLNLFATLYTVDNLLYELKHTTAYKQSLKKAINILCKELEPYFGSALEPLFDAAPTDMATVVENTLGLINNLMHVRPEYWQYAAKAAEWCVSGESNIRFRQLEALVIQAKNDPKP